MAGGSLLQQLQEALAAEKHSKTEAVEAVEREMQAQLELAEVHRTHALEQQETFWTSELASERESKEITVGGLEDEIASLKLQVEDWRRLEVTENMMKDEAEASVLSLQLLCGEQRVQLHQLRNEADVAANAERVISRLEMSQEEGERHRKEAFDLRVTVAALNERCKRQEEALARRTQSARSNLPRPPIAGRREGALRGLARESEQAHLKTVEEDGNLPESWSMSEASQASLPPDAFVTVRELQQENAGGYDSPASSVLPDSFAVARGGLFPRDPSITSLSEASSLLDPFTVVRGLDSESK